MSFLPSIEGALSAKPVAAIAGTVGEALESPKAGALAAPVTSALGGSLQNSAIAEVGNLISSLGTLSAQAQSLPLSPPTLPGLPQNQSYKPQATDYTQFSDDSN